MTNFIFNRGWEIPAAGSTSIVDGVISAKSPSYQQESKLQL